MQKCFTRHTRMEQIELNKTKKQKKKVRRDEWEWKEVQYSVHKKESPDSLTVAGPTIPSTPINCSWEVK